MLDMQLMRLQRALKDKLGEYDARIERACGKLESLGPRNRVDLYTQRLDALEHRLNLARDAYISSCNTRLKNNELALARFNPESAVNTELRRLADCDTRMKIAIARRIKTGTSNIDALWARLDALNPENVLKRGYAIVTVGGNAVSNAHDIQPGDLMDVRMRDGNVSALTIDISEQRGG